MHTNITNHKELPFKMKYFKKSSLKFQLGKSVFSLTKEKGLDSHLIYLAMNCENITEICCVEHNLRPESGLLDQALLVIQLTPDVTPLTFVQILII